MNVSKATICLGANTPDAADRLAAAYSVLTISGAVVRATPPYPTAPEYSGETEPYLNQIVVLATSLTLEQLGERTKAYQTAVRADNPHAPLVNIDIDIVEWDGTVLRPADACSAYYRQGIEMLNFAQSR